MLPDYDSSKKANSKTIHAPMLDDQSRRKHYIQSIPSFIQKLEAVFGQSPSQDIKISSYPESILRSVRPRYPNYYPYMSSLAIPCANLSSNNFTNAGGTSSCVARMVTRYIYHCMSATRQNPVHVNSN